MKNLSSSNGQTLIEVLAALGIATLLVSVISVAVLAALFNAQFSKNQNLASQHAQEGMEIVRKIRDEDFAAFDSLEKTSYCLNKDQRTILESDKQNSTVKGCAKQVGQPGQNVGVFVRQVDIAKDPSKCGGNNATKVTMSVSWSDSKCTSDTNSFCHKVQLVSCLSDPSVQAP